MKDSDHKGSDVTLRDLIEGAPLPPSEPPRIAVISYKGLSRLIQSVTPRYDGRAQFLVVDKVFDEAITAARELIARNAVDVIISAGANATYLRDRVDIPVIRINVSGFDILRALMKASRFSDKVALINYRETDANLEEVKHLINVDIEQRSYTTIEDARLQFRELKQLGYRVVVGSSFVTDLSENEGLTGILTYSEQAIHQAVDMAIEVTRTQRIEQGRQAWLNQVIQHLQEGVIAVDRDQLVQCFNPASRRILGVETDLMLRRPLHELVPGLVVESGPDNDAEPQPQVLRIGSRLIMATCVPLREIGVDTGFVITLQDSAAIERADRRIRTQRSPREYAARYHLDDIIGESPVIQRMINLARQYAQSDSTVLLVGESGTGKELFAQGIHNASPRSDGRFVAINCAGFAESLLESELFGYEEGAFTGARKGGRVGLIEAAHGGTLFLDEVGDMPTNLQTRLLRVLQEREVTRVGGTIPTPVDVRVIAATNVELRERIESGDLREDLYYRLNILSILVPPLRARTEDIPLLAGETLRRLLHEAGVSADPEPVLAALRDRLLSYSWPGNVREMENFMERLAVFITQNDDPLSASGQKALYSILPELLISDSTDEPGTLRAKQRSVEIDRIQRVFTECEGNMAEVARKLGVSRTTLWRKLRQR